MTQKTPPNFIAQKEREIRFHKFELISWLFRGKQSFDIKVRKGEMKFFHTQIQPGITCFYGIKEGRLEFRWIISWL